jgi:carbon-monoxide dehydrogenase medium subunit
VPVRRAEAEKALIGSRLDAKAIDRAAEALLAACDPVDDVRGSAEYRRRLVPRLLRRAVDTMLSRLEKAS